jgi:ral guanine nucleotide dissociation stimulator-like 1
VFQAISYGTIPYLGTFLTDLTMIDTAIGDVLPDGLINFDKRRKEFEVLAQIKLLQGAANAYQIEKQEHFVRWFESVLLLDERQAFELSCQIELQPPNITNNSSSSNEKYSSSTNNNNNYSSSANSAARENKYKKKQANGNFHHRKNDSIASTASSSSGSQVKYF